MQQPVKIPPYLRCFTSAQAGNILIDHQGQVILADMGIATAMTRSHRLHEGGALDSQPQA